MRKWIIITPLALIAMLMAGAISFASFVEHTSTTEFCISCHEMKSTVYEEYKKSVHYRNEAGVRATCSDCHVPHSWSQVMVRKAMAVRDVYHHLLGTLDTTEKFEAHRLELAQRVWSRMKTNGSQECRNCHNFDAMALDKQRLRAQKQHQNAMNDGRTCIDCHKGIAHKAVHQAAQGTSDNQGDMSLDF